MTKTKQASAFAEPAAPALAKRKRKAKDYLVPPIVVPLALSMLIMIYILLRGAA